MLAPITAFPCHATDYLYRKAKAIAWKDFFGVHHTLAVFANLSNSKLRHSQYAALCLKDAIVDYFREDCGRRPNVGGIDPDVWINLFIENNHAVISIDTSGGSLHRRGYREEGVEAPMQETVAAAVMRWTGWDGAQPLFDPMCGSGTLLSEALMHYCRIPAGRLRQKFGFERLPDYENLRRWCSAANRRPSDPAASGGVDRRQRHCGGSGGRVPGRRTATCPTASEFTLTSAISAAGRKLRPTGDRLQPALRHPPAGEADLGISTVSSGIFSTALPGFDGVRLFRQPRDAQYISAEWSLEAAAKEWRPRRPPGPFRTRPARTFLSGC